MLHLCGCSTAMQLKLPEECSDIVVILLDTTRSGRRASEDPKSSRCVIVEMHRVIFWHGTITYWHINALQSYLHAHDDGPAIFFIFAILYVSVALATSVGITTLPHALCSDAAFAQL